MRAIHASAVADALSSHAVVDVRDAADFALRHLAGSGHLPLDELSTRRGELPPRDAALLVVAGDGARAEEAARRVEDLGYGRVAWLDASPAELPEGLLSDGPARPLWRPSPFLEQVAERLPDPRAARRRVLDLAAGAGRESVFMALRGYQVDAWDHDRGALDKAAAMARRHGVTIATETCDFETREPRLPVAAHDVVMVFRFLHRPLFPRIAAAVAPGGFVVYETYLRGQERFGRPRHPRFLLDSGELPRHFPGFDVERYEELTPEEGPMLARLLARRPQTTAR
jgi:rhodanese-related sulfurtransferase